MSVKRMACFTLLCALVAQAAQAAPTLSVVPIGLNGGNREWFVNIAPDPALFSNNPPNGIGGSLALEIGFTIDSPVHLLSATIADTVAWPMENFGNSPFPFGGPPADGLTILGDRMFVAQGSTYFTSATPTHLIKFTTSGSGPTTVRWLGAYGGNGRIAQAGQNYDLYSGFVTVVPEPTSCALMIVGMTAELAIGRRKRFA